MNLREARQLREGNDVIANIDTNTHRRITKGRVYTLTRKAEPITVRDTDGERRITNVHFYVRDNNGKECIISYDECDLLDSTPKV